MFVIEVPDLDAALASARRCPAAEWGSVEIRSVAVTYARGKGWYQPERGAGSGHRAGSRVLRPVVGAELDGPDAGLSALDAIADPAVERFQPAWAARARLLVTAGRPAAAAKAYRAAIDLSTDAGVVKYLQRRLVAVARR
ncbi:hypothetical protein A4G26_00985 [Mycobacterium kansasii]|uniref:Uncharacterized protein n=1 Tax=Mycobacterium innocens TaxID=2341083 RepID=A0A498Q513_9MYCO|nr:MULTISPECIES: YciI family protein [Mycobacterium]KZS63683.1 hypothetical protein A4G26_00985 [Mycobacterium kansasii]VBA38910.1 hypothetical protein LAUMK13_02337 [Mycobacterium innocens]